MMFAKDGPLDKPELALAGCAVLLDDVGACDVRRHQVGRELDAVELEFQDLRDRRDEQRLGQPGHTDHQHVAAREHRQQQFLDDLLLADDDLMDFLQQEVACPAELFDDLEFFRAVGRFVGQWGLPKDRMTNDEGRMTNQKTMTNTQ